MKIHEIIVESTVYDPSVDEGWKDVAAAGALALGMAGAPGTAAANTKAAPTVAATQTATAAPNQLENILIKTARANGIKGKELAQFLAQTKHESWDFSKMHEQGSGKNYFNKKYDPKYAPKTAKILGNKMIGDGERYKGRGYIQLTGRDNYTRAGEALGIPLVDRPELAANPEVAAKIAVWYWNVKVKPYVQNWSDTATVTKKINPALRGLQDRHANFIDYLKQARV